MRAAVTVAPHTVEIQERPQPAATAGTAVIRIHTVTLCGTDAHIFEGLWPMEYPIVQGHEFVGVVEALPEGDAIGADGAALAVGDRVAVDPIITCGHCYACTIGRRNGCESMSYHGTYVDGGLVEFLSMPLDSLYRVPASLPLDISSLSEPLSIAMQAVDRGRPVAGEKALVIGCGPIGVLATLYLADLGVEVIAADTVPSRLDIATAMGAAHTLLVDPAGEFPSERQAAELAQWTTDWGPSLVIEATGQPESFENALRIVASAGRISLVGISNRETTYSMRTVPVKDIDILGSHASDRQMGRALEILNRHQAQARSLVTHRFPLAELARAFETLGSRTEVVGKIAIDLTT